MREYKKVKKEVEILDKIICDECFDKYFVKLLKKSNVSHNN